MEAENISYVFLVFVHHNGTWSGVPQLRVWRWAAHWGSLYKMRASKLERNRDVGDAYPVNRFGGFCRDNIGDFD